MILTHRKPSTITVGGFVLDQNGHELVANFFGPIFIHFTKGIRFEVSLLLVYKTFNLTTLGRLIIGS